MTMKDKGLTQLVEACGNLLQVAAKKQTVVMRNPSLASKVELEDSIAQIFASIMFVVSSFDLDFDVIERKGEQRLKLLNHLQTIDESWSIFLQEAPRHLQYVELALITEPLVTKGFLDENKGCFVSMYNPQTTYSLDSIFAWKHWEA